MSIINIENPDNVRSYRHKAVNLLQQARAAVTARGIDRTDAQNEVYRLLNGSIETILRGRSGLTQEQQVEYLKNAREVAEENLNALPEAVEALKAELTPEAQSEKRQAALDAAKARYEEKVTAINARFDAVSPEALDEIPGTAAPVLALLDEAAEFAANRDFDAHQQAKRERQQAAYAAEGYDVVDFDEEDED